MKVMQSIYAMHQNGSDNLEKEEKFLFFSMDSVLDLYLIMLSALVEIRAKEIDYLDKSSKKHLATAEERKPNRRFVDNAILKMLSENQSLSASLKSRKIDNWARNDDYILIILAEIKKSELYDNYMAAKASDFDQDRQFAIDLFMELIAPNDKLYDYLEDHKLTWIDDIPLVNTQIVKQLRTIKSENDSSFSVPRLYKDAEDQEFASTVVP
jgi:N utilization substance protein B